MAGVFPPGDEAGLVKNIHMHRDMLGFMNNECDEGLSKVKGHGYVFKLKHFDDPRKH